MVDVPQGWRHEPGADGIGVLAPADAYADQRPVVAGPRLELESIAAACWLDAGYPAAALLALRDTFVKGPSCRAATLLSSGRCGHAPTEISAEPITRPPPRPDGCALPGSVLLFEPH